MTQNAEGLTPRLTGGYDSGASFLTLRGRDCLPGGTGEVMFSVLNVEGSVLTCSTNKMGRLVSDS